MEDNNKTVTAKSSNRKILVQIGLVIIILFSVVIIAVGNMVTMSSFSTSLSNNVTMFIDYMSDLSDDLEEYRSITWLMDYWRENADTLVTKDERMDEKGNIDDILESLSEEDVEDITAEEASSLSPKDQRRFAVWCYHELLEIFKSYQGESEEEECAIFLTMTDSEEEDRFLIMTNSPDGEILLGRKEDIKEILKTVENTSTAVEPEVWKWAFTTPEEVMLFGTGIYFDPYQGNSTAELIGVFYAESVYSDMVYTEHIRNEVILLMLIVLALILIFLYFIVPRPLSKVKKYLSEYADTKDAERLTAELSTIRSRNEIGALADQFSALALEMERYTKEMEILAGEKERVATELNVAANIQMQMLPWEFPERKEFRLYAAMNPAKEVGGDFYDCYMIDDDHLALTIADVSGKGVPAALFMAVSKTMLKNRTNVGGNPSEILRDVNNWLCEGNDSCMFVTVWLGILTISTGSLISANAGHENPGLRSGGDPFRLIRTDHGSPLGLMEGIEFSNEEYTLSSGDALFVYTDGVPEANAGDGTMFGEERLESVLSEVSPEDAPETIMKKVRAAVDGFAGDTPQYDDLTMLCLVIN
ncbi:MAG: SpoIIE family protein phosphatase [Lachnospiraceae bacterium]|nr:SpoIIE family protein phosphatase [Lachnospiraceae bacterium]